MAATFVKSEGPFGVGRVDLPSFPGKPTDVASHQAAGLPAVSKDTKGNPVYESNRTSIGDDKVSLTVTKPPKTNWNLDTKQHEGVYALYLVDPEVRILNLPSGINLFDGSAETQAIHPFLTPPSTIDVDEEAAASIQPMIDLGIYSDEQGQAVKHINLEGTTGLRGNLYNGYGSSKGRQVNGPVDRLIPGQDILSNTAKALLPTGPINLGPLEFSDRDVRGLAQGEITGFDEAMSLKNLFRLYWDIKNNKLRDFANPVRTQMVWADLYSYEFWIVIPRRLRVRRNARRQFLFDYQIQLSAIAPLDKKINAAYKVREVTTGTLFSAARELIGSYRETFTDAVDIVNLTMNKVQNEFTSTVFTGVQAFNETKALLTGEDTSAFANIKDRYQSIAEGANQLGELFPTFGAGSTSTSGGSLTRNQPVTSIDRENSFKESNKAALQLKTSLEETSSVEVSFDSGLPRAASDIIRSTDAMLSGLAGISTELKVVQTDIELIRSEFALVRDNEDLESPSAAADESSGILDARNLTDPDALGNEVVREGDTIYDAAQRLLGSKLDYKILIMVNRLRWPYISDVSSEGVLGPGDTIFFPKEPLSTNSQVPQQANETYQDRYGTDIAVDPIDGGYRVLTNGSGDFALVSGADNLAQAMFLKHNTPQGDLPAHPGYGMPVKPGMRASVAFFADLDVKLKAMYLSDPRVAAVKAVRTRYVGGDQLFINTEVVATGTSEVIQQEFIL